MFSNWKNIFQNKVVELEMVNIFNINQTILFYKLIIYVNFPYIYKNVFLEFLYCKEKLNDDPKLIKM